MEENRTRIEKHRNIRVKVKVTVIVDVIKAYACKTQTWMTSHKRPRRIKDQQRAQTINAIGGGEKSPYISFTKFL